VKIVNLTPHEIHLPDRTVPPSDFVARCNEVTKDAGDFDGVKLIQREYGDVYGLPDPAPETLYIVSLLVRQACPQRKDLASPGDLVRDGEGKIVGAKNLVIN